MSLDFLNLCKKMIEIESTPSVGNEEIAHFCAEHFAVQSLVWALRDLAFTP